MARYIVAVSGASGAQLGLRLAGELLREKGAEIHLVITDAAFSILRHEAGLKLKGTSAAGTEKLLREHIKAQKSNLFFHPGGDLEAPVASGSFRTETMFVVPCSMKTLSGIANGYADTLIERAADVIIKEGRRLVLAPREMPFSAIHLENMLKLARLGVVIAPPVMGFYPRPESIDDMERFVTGKLLDRAGLENSLYRRWKDK
jgi:4-hydroxy-3-polyprenylbenzoate decarboxylase